MSKTEIEVIALLGQPVLKEGNSKVALKPGQVVTYDGDVETIKLGATGSAMGFVLENDLIGKGINDQYDIGENVRYGKFRTGDIVYAKVKDTNTPAAKIAFGDGVKVVAGYVTKGAGLGYALQDSNVAGESFIKVEIA